MAKKSDGKPFTARETMFIELIADHTDARSIPAKTLAAGYAHEKQGYALLKRPEITDAIEARVNQAVKVIRNRRGSVIAALANRAESSAPNANEAAKLYLQTTGDIGSGGHTVKVDVTQNNKDDSLEESMESIEAKREKRLREMT